MAIEKLEFKACTKCGVRYPATTEYFYKGSRGGLMSVCANCHKKWAREYKGKKEEPETGFSINNLNNVRAKYTVGQIIQTKWKNDNRGAPEEWQEGEITGLYDHFMVVKLKHYTTTVLYKDILLGAVKVK